MSSESKSIDGEMEKNSNEITEDDHIEEEKVEELTERKESPWKDSLKRKWYRFSQNPLSLVGLSIAIITIFLTLFGEYISPHPEHAFFYSNYQDAFVEPFQTMEYPFGTDEYGRDVLTRTIFGFRYAMTMVVVVLTLSVPTGVTAGLVAGYHKDTWVDTLIMRIADVFIAVPPLVLALSITAMVDPGPMYAMLAVSLMWWTWYTRIVYNNVSSLVNEEFVKSAEIMGDSKLHIMFSEILPNCTGAILTKATLDVGWVIIVGASLSFVGLGAQAPTPDLGTMVANGADWMPGRWWVAIFPAIAISFIILGFNLLGDGIQDAFEEGS